MKNRAKIYSGIVFLLILTLPGSVLLAQDSSSKSTSGDEVVYTEKDAAIFEDIIRKYRPHREKDIGQLIPKIGEYFLGQEYVAHTLEVTDKEMLIVNLRELDCTTYAENLLALARTLKSEEATFERFTRELERIRYRNGAKQDYPSRLHYFSDWLYNNAQNDLVTLPSEDFGEPYENNVDFMSTHPESYKHLKLNPDFISVIKQQEQEISQRRYHFLPKEKIGEYLKYLKEGDIVGITTDINGLDIAHVGILVEVGGSLHLMHASQSNLKVEVSDEPISSFLKPNSKNSGLMVARPLNPLN